MIALALANWKWAVPTAAAAILGIWLGVTKLELANLRADIAEATAKATEQARAKDAENAKLANQIDLAHLERNDAIEKAAAAARELNRTRGSFVRVKAPKCDLPGTTSDLGGGENGTTQAQLSDETADALIAIAHDADRAAAYAQTCHDWAIQVGR